ncbi:FAD-binding oxidoreductase [Chitinivorax sp. PXF-14]|uniref:NAD(P)/FAD-dependent oxidoreductase n=1 Tax=Chitinivorax sp. PXF-14 TaxID=3230488 RepID=UPI003467416B
MFARDAKLNHHSYYEASISRPVPEPALAGAVTADVCVVGGGLAGLSAAIELAQRGYRVTLLEARDIGWGASGRNGGQAIAGYACSNGVFERAQGIVAARQAWQVSLDAMGLLRERIERFAIDCDFVPGYMTVAVGAKNVRALRDDHAALATRYHYDQLRFIEPAEIRDWIASPRYRAGLYDAGSGHLHPLKYTLGLKRAAAVLGVAIHEHSEVTRLTHGSTVTVHTAGGQVSASHAVLAGNVYLGPVAARIAARIMPVGTYIIATEPLGAERADALIRQRIAVCDNHFVLDYFRVTADHRMLFGGRVSYSGLTPPNLPTVMRGNMVRAFPQLADAKIAYCWGGFVDITMNRAPDFGRLAPNVFYLQGFSGHGLALTGMAGRLAAEAIAGQAERFDLFARLPHRPFPGGPWLRTPALALGMLYYRLRDLL